MNVKKGISYIYIISAAALWGAISVFNKLLTGMGFAQLEIIFIRSFVALAGTFIYVLIKDKELLKIKIMDVWCFVGSGIISLLMFNICYFNAMQESISVAAVLLYTAPAFVVIISALLFNEKVTVKKICALLLMMLGCVMVTGLTFGISVSLPCVFLGIGSGIGYALYSIFGRIAINKGYKSETITLYTFLLSTIGNIPLINISGVISKIDINALAGALGIGILCCLMPYIFYTKGLEGVKNGQASAIATIEPIVATFIGLLYGESLGLNNAIGILLVLLSIMIINREDS